MRSRLGRCRWRLAGALRKQHVHRDAIALREHAYEIFHTVVHGHPLPSASVRFFNDHHARGVDEAAGRGP